MTSILHNTRRHDITFRANGCIDITSRVGKALDLRTGDVVDVAVDGRECYLYVKYRAGVVVGRHEAQVYPTNRAKRRGFSMRCHSKRLCAAVLEMCGVDDVARLMTGEMTEHGLPLITRVNNAR